MHNINTRNKHHLHRPVANLSCFQKGVSHSGIRIFNSLPRSITILRMIRHSLKKLKEIFKYTLLLLCRWIFHMYRWYVIRTYNCVNVYNILHCNIFMFVCLWHVPHPMSCDSHRDLWNACMHVCMMTSSALPLLEPLREFPNVQLQKFVSYRL